MRPLRFLLAFWGIIVRHCHGSLDLLHLSQPITRHRQLKFKICGSLVEISVEGGNLYCTSTYMMMHQKAGRKLNDLGLNNYSRRLLESFGLFLQKFNADLDMKQMYCFQVWIRCS
jgi:hypothetical protein